MRPLVSIIIPAYRITQNLYDCLFSLKARTDYPNYEAIVIHSDGSFAENVNRGIQAAKGEFILLLNDDCIIVQNQWLTMLVDLMESDPKIGAVSPKMIFPGGKIQFAGMIFHPTFEGGHLGWGWNAEDSRLLKEPTEFQATTFGCVLLRRSALNEMEVCEKYLNRDPRKDQLTVEYLDESYKIGGFEDVDACFRMKLADWKMFYQPNSIVQHVESATFNAIDQEKRRLSFIDNRAYYHSKWDKYFQNGTFKVDDVDYEGARV